MDGNTVVKTLGRFEGIIVGFDGATLGDIVGNGPLVNAGDKADFKYGTIAFTVWKSLFNTPMVVIPTAQLMPFCPCSKLVMLSLLNSPFMYLTSVFSHWSSATG